MQHLDDIRAKQTLPGFSGKMVHGGSSSLGNVHVIPSHTPHSAVAVTDGKIIDSFAPARDDYR